MITIHDDEILEPAVETIPQRKPRKKGKGDNSIVLLLLLLLAIAAAMYFNATKEETEG
jgi:hypothetical protein